MNRVLKLYETRLIFSVSFFFLCVLLGGCDSPTKTLQSYKITGETMGTQYHITLVSSQAQPVNVDELQLGVDQELVKINQIMSTYIPDSELMQFNRAKVGEAKILSPPLMEVLELSLLISKKSSGAFDVTVGPLVNLWGFGASPHSDQVPDSHAIALAKNKVGYQFLQLKQDTAVRTLDVSIDLSAVAKGYGVDWIVAMLSDRGYENFMVEIGGEVRVQGVSERGTAWRIAVEQPAFLQGDVRLVLELHDHAIATSGDYRNYFEVEGKRYSHTIDPETGSPIMHNLASVTVVADTAARADAWATALNVLGPTEGLALANAEQLAVYMIVKTKDGFADIQSNEFSKLLP